MFYLNEEQNKSKLKCNLDQISIYGPGLLGASIAMAIRERDFKKKIWRGEQKP